MESCLRARLPPPRREGRNAVVGRKRNAARCAIITHCHLFFCTPTYGLSVDIGNGLWSGAGNGHLDPCMPHIRKAVRRSCRTARCVWWAYQDFARTLALPFWQRKPGIYVTGSHLVKKRWRTRGEPPLCQAQVGETVLQLRPRRYFKNTSFLVRITVPARMRQ